MSKHLTPAQRDALAVQCYELSLEGLSLREIARRKGISHPTVSTLVREEAERRRRPVDNRTQRVIDMQMKAINRLWEELHKNPSPHSVANLAHALRGLLSDVAKISGVVPPDRVAHYHKLDFQTVIRPVLDNWFAVLNDEELTMLEYLSAKAEGHIPPETDILAMAFGKYRRGELASAPSPEQELIEVPDYPLRELE